MNTQLIQAERKFWQGAIATVLRILAYYYPLYKGRGYLCQFKLFCWTLSGQGSIWTYLKKEGLWLLVPLDDFNGRLLYYFGGYIDIKWVCKRILRPADNVIDIGANLGFVTHISRQIVGTQGQVHAFEPQSQLVDLMRQSLERNGYTDVVIHNIALGKNKEQQPFFIPIHHCGGASLIASSGYGPKTRTISVPVENAGTYLSKLGLSHIRLMKMDVEGYEAEIIEGALDFLKVTPPDAILFEIMACYHNIPFCQQPVVKLLSQLDYQFLNITKVYFKMRLQPIESTSHSMQYGNDILAVRNGKIYNEIAKLVGAIS